MSGRLRTFVIAIFLVTSLAFSGVPITTAETASPESELLVETGTDSLEGADIVLFDSAYEYVDDTPISDGEVRFDGLSEGTHYIEIYTDADGFVEGQAVTVDGATTVWIGESERDTADQQDDNDGDATDDQDVQDSSDEETADGETSSEPALLVETGTDSLENADVVLFDSDYEYVDDAPVSDGEVRFDALSEGTHYIEVYTDADGFVEGQTVSVDGTTTAWIGDEADIRDTTDQQDGDDGTATDEEDPQDSGNEEDTESETAVETELIVETGTDSLEDADVILFDSAYEHADDAAISDGEVRFGDLSDGTYYIEVYTDSDGFVEGQTVSVDGTTTAWIGDEADARDGSDDQDGTDDPDATDDDPDATDDDPDATDDDQDGTDDDPDATDDDQDGTDDDPDATDDDQDGTDDDQDGTDDEETERDTSTETELLVETGADSLENADVVLFDSDYEYVDDAPISGGEVRFDALSEGTHYIEVYTDADGFVESQTVSVDGTTTVSIGDDADGQESTDDLPERDDPINAIYVWGFADELVTQDDAAERFFERMEADGYDTVYLSVHVIEATSDDELSSFLTEAHDRGLEVEALIGLLGADSMDAAEYHTEEILAYNAEKSGDERFDGIHYDLEPGSPDELEPFLTEYASFLDGVSEVSTGDETIASQELTIAADIGWWWASHEPETTYDLVDHAVFDYVAVMAYYDTTSEVRNRLSNIVSETDTPYVLAVETMQFSGTNDDYRATFYEEGPESLAETTDTIAADPPSDGYLGIAHHYYGSSISSWDALREATLQSANGNPGETIDVETTVVFDSDFADSALESRLVVQLDGEGDTYATEATIAPSAGTPETATVSWTVPADVAPGEYDVSVTLLDTTYVDGDQEAMAPRDEPVELDSIDAGTVTIHDSQ
ncbi:hypothetical protein [Natronoglomus mannanivorans]|uniref:Uncharacterized protein n=1 Tax=Natronoglomus mannanivorans TaxID=2979990 RepID=A0AAP2Z1N0_9EURY|nr:hypothetical protein [Halobacteria archaeon AArc-xg1-1]